MSIIDAAIEQAKRSVINIDQESSTGDTSQLLGRPANTGALLNALPQEPRRMTGADFVNVRDFLPGPARPIPASTAFPAMHRPLQIGAFRGTLVGDNPIFGASLMISPELIAGPINQLLEAQSLRRQQDLAQSAEGLREIDRKLGKGIDPLYENKIIRQYMDWENGQFEEGLERHNGNYNEWVKDIERGVSPEAIKYNEGKQLWETYGRVLTFKAQEARKMLKQAVNGGHTSGPTIDRLKKISDAVVELNKSHEEGIVETDLDDMLFVAGNYDKAINNFLNGADVNVRSWMNQNFGGEGQPGKSLDPKEINKAIEIVRKQYYTKDRKRELAKQFLKNNPQFEFSGLTEDEVFRNMDTLLGPGRIERSYRLYFTQNSNTTSIDLPGGGAQIDGSFIGDLTKTVRGLADIKNSNGDISKYVNEAQMLKPSRIPGFVADVGITITDDSRRSLSGKPSYDINTGQTTELGDVSGVLAGIHILETTPNPDQTAPAPLAGSDNIMIALRYATEKDVADLPRDVQIAIIRGEIDKAKATAQDTYILFDPSNDVEMADLGARLPSDIKTNWKDLMRKLYGVKTEPENKPEKPKGSKSPGYEPGR